MFYSFNIHSRNSTENFYFKFFSEYPLEAVGRKAIDLYIDVFRSNSQKNVVHGTAHAATPDSEFTALKCNLHAESLYTAIY